MKTLNAREVIWQLVASIPKGRVATYGQIAKMAGFPNHARYVGSVLKYLPSDTRLPWHRVVNAQGKSSFPEGSDAQNKQLQLLQAEGVAVFNNRVSLSKFGWQP